MGFKDDLKSGVNKKIENLSTDKELDELKALELGAVLHDDWRKGRLKSDGTYEPRWKKVKDSNFKFNESNTCRKNEDGDIEIDIANRTFEELSSNWQYENLEAGKVAQKLVGEKTELTSEEMEELASEVHVEWLKRNDWVYDPNYGDPKLAVPYSKLSEEEKEKDRAQLKMALQLNQNILEGKVTKKELKLKFDKSKDNQVIE